MKLSRSREWSLSPRRYGAGLIGFLMLVSCQSSPPASASPEKQTSQAQTKPQPTQAGAPKKTSSSKVAELGKYRLPAPKRLVAIGDVHGDLAATRAVLRLAGATNDQDEWVGGELVVVQTGDQLDRGDSEREILDLLARLQKQARAAGGSVHVLLGNHETMNVSGDFRYVTAGGFQGFGDVTNSLPSNIKSQLPPQAHARAAAFLPGGAYARQLAPNPVVLVVGDSVFVHGGVLPKHVKYGIPKLNREVTAWFEGKGEPPRVVHEPDAPVWTRLYSDGVVGAQACRTLDKVLSSLGVKRMVVGHTIQKTASAACGGKVWRIDVGMSAHYGGSQVEALEIAGGTVRVLRGNKGG